MDLSIAGRLGMVIDGTGRDYDKIKSQVAELRQLGYDCYMIFVNTSLDVALERNKRRERTVPEYITKTLGQKYKVILVRFQNLFGMENMIIVDNSKDDRELTTVVMSKVDKVCKKIIKK